MLSPVRLLHVRWANYISSVCKFPTVHMCQKLSKLAGSRQSYCKNYQAYFFGPPCMYQPNLQSVALVILEIIAIAVLGWSWEPQSWGRGGRRGSGIVPFKRAFVTS